MVLGGQWYVYVLVSERTGKTYVGVSTNTQRRVMQHNGEKRGGAKSTRAGRPWKIGAVYGPYEDRAAAQKIEVEVKRLNGLARCSFKA